LKATQKTPKQIPDENMPDAEKPGRFGGVNSVPGDFINGGRMLYY